MADIDISFYNTGTASVENGETLVTGQGVDWNAVRAGDLFGTHVGLPVRIASVNAGASELTLAHPWPGASQSTAVYEIQRTPYDAGYQPTARRIFQFLSDAQGNLEAFGGLAGDEDLLPYFTGLAEMDTTALTALGRAIIGSADTTAAQTALGGTAVGRAVFGAANQTAARSAMAALGTGDFGLGATSVPEVTASNALNNIADTGWVRVAGGNVATVGGPSGASGGVVWTGAFTTNNKVQTYYQITTTPRIWRRIFFSGSWSTWRADIESGSNSNGYFVRLGDGTQICTGQSGDNSGMIVQGNVFSAAVSAVTFAAAFSAAPIVTTHAVRTSGGGTGVAWSADAAEGVTSTTAALRLGGSALSTVGFIRYIAVGRWY